MMMMSVRPARTASSTTYWIAGLSRSGSISLGIALVAGRKRVPSPAAGMTAFRTFLIAPPQRGAGVYPQGTPRRSRRRGIAPAAEHGQASIPRYTLGMPTYEYECTSCGQHVEVFQHFSEDPLATCGVCGGKLRKVFHPAGIVFKGSGFYATDSRSGAKSGSKRDGESGSSSPSEGASTSSSSSSSDGSSKGSEGGSSKGSEGSSKGSKGGSSSSRRAKETSSS